MTYLVRLLADMALGILFVAKFFSWFRGLKFLPLTVEFELYDFADIVPCLEEKDSAASFGCQQCGARRNVITLRCV